MVLSLELAREYFRYDPHTGHIFWIKAHKKANRKVFAKAAGYVADNGGRHIEFLGKAVQASRLAWLLHYGEWPDRWIDHVNGNRDDNRIENLRLATPGENARNRNKGKNNTSGYKGVHWAANCQKWRARIIKDRKAINLGLFDTPEAARDAYNAVVFELHGEFARAA